MNREDNKQENKYKVLDSPKDLPKRSVLLLVRDSVRPYVQDYISKYVGTSDEVNVAYPDNEHSIDELLNDGCDIAVVDPLAYTGVNKISDLVSKVTAHTRQGLIIVQRNFEYQLEPTVLYQEMHESPVKPARLAERVYELLFPQDAKNRLHPRYT